MSISYVNVVAPYHYALEVFLPIMRRSNKMYPNKESAVLLCFLDTLYKVELA